MKRSNQRREERVYELIEARTEYDSSFHHIIIIPSSLRFHFSNSPSLLSVSSLFGFLLVFFIGMRRNQFLRSSIHRLLLLLLSLLLVSSIPGSISSREVTLGSIEIYNAHEFWPQKPLVYFSCKGENKTILPDVKTTNFLYSFKGQESWQPLTELPEKKCKRCGVYEQDTFKSDDVYDEWEMCSDDFVKGEYIHLKDKEFNATFICPDCGGGSGSHNSTAAPDIEEPKKEKNIAIVVVVSVLVSIVTVIAAVTIYKYWQRRKREQDQLRFLKLFEENDDLEDELALGHVI